jgi:hypothetical protein
MDYTLRLGTTSVLPYERLIMNNEKNKGSMLTQEELTTTLKE